MSFNSPNRRILARRQGWKVADGHIAVFCSPCQALRVARHSGRGVICFKLCFNSAIF
jgi:hypothetical protein